MQNEFTYYKVKWSEVKDTGTILFWEKKEIKVYSLGEAREIKEDKQTITGHEATIIKITEIAEVVK